MMLFDNFENNSSLQLLSLGHSSSTTRHYLKIKLDLKYCCKNDKSVKLLF
jgi:hypothetical protein